MNVLAFELSSGIGSIALATAAGIDVRTIDAPRAQTAQLLPLADALLTARGLAPAALDAVAFGRGPGSFTGLRVAAAATQGLAMATGVPVVGVSSLAALAQRAWREHAIDHALVAVDARMGEIYRGEFRIEGGLARAVCAERIDAPAALPDRVAAGCALVGDAFARHADALAGLMAAAGRVEPGLTACARDVLALALPELEAGRGVPAEEALPVYLRDASAWRRP